MEFSVPAEKNRAAGQIVAWVEFDIIHQRERGGRFELMVVAPDGSRWWVGVGDHVRANVEIEIK